MEAVDVDGLAAFRVLLGVVVTVGSVRFLLSGWPELLYGEPRFFFRYAGFGWVPLLEPSAIRTLYALMAGCGLAITLGVGVRMTAAIFAFLFAWVQLHDVTNYLNHYWLLWWLVVLVAIIPTSARWSLRSWRRHQASPAFPPPTPSIPRLAYWVFRFQVGCVYVFAALAKVGEDWLVFGQPLGVWLPPRSGLPVVGPLLAFPQTSLFFSWSGFLYDLSIVPLLLWSRSRPIAYLLVVVFHVATSLLFEIGMFPAIMIAATTVFFHPSWPKRLLERLVHRSLTTTTLQEPHPRPSTAPSAALLALLLLYVGFQLAMPLRHVVIADRVLWDEAGMRFSWRVMVREKSGSLQYRVRLGDKVDGTAGRTVLVSPHEWLTWRQVNEMVGQPDLILQLAHAIRDDFNARSLGPVEVRADALVTLNGRLSTTLIDPDVDLAAADDCLFCRLPFIMPAPSTTPPAPWRQRPHRAQRMTEKP